MRVTVQSHKQFARKVQKYGDAFSKSSSIFSSIFLIQIATLIDALNDTEVTYMASFTCIHMFINEKYHRLIITYLFSNVTTNFAKYSKEASKCKLSEV